ncbi:MAG: hypothetical protein ACHQF2_05100 [Flavobacteriales bacterium]
MSRDRQKSPEEMAALKAAMAKQKQASDADEAIRKVRNGQIIIFVIAGIIVISALVVYYTMLKEMAVFYLYAPFFVAFVLMGIFYYRNPYGISITALCIYGGLLLLDVADDPTALFKGIILKVIIIAGLIRAIKYGRDYKVAIRNKPVSDILDEDFT